MQVRKTSPSSTNKYYIYRGNKGYNDCIRINKKTGSCLPNCVGYAWGATAEMLGLTKKGELKLSRSNAENWWDHNDGYERRNYPSVGDVVCWRKGQAHKSSDGAGHVGIVIAVYDDKTILVAQSAYNGTRWYLTKIKAPYKIGAKYHLQGFIHVADVEPNVWVEGKYELLKSKYIRKTPEVANNYVLVKDCMKSVQVKLTSNKPNDKARFKIGVSVDITGFETDKKGNVWGKMKNTYICVEDSTGKQVKKI